MRDVVGGSGSDSVNGVVALPNGVVAVGVMGANATAGTGDAGQTSLTDAGGKDAFIVRY